MKNRVFMFAALIAIAAFLSSGSVQQSADQLYQSGLYKEDVEGKLEEAIAVYQDIIKKYPGEREIAAKALLHIGMCYQKLGTIEAEKAFQKVINDFPEQLATVKLAREKLSIILLARSAAGPAAKEVSVRLIWSGPDAVEVRKASPDGLFLCYIDSKTGNLFLKELTTGKTSAVTNKKPSEKSFEFVVNSCWSPDGKKLAYGWFNKENSVELRTVNTDGSDVRILYQQKNEMAFPMAWSPDGRTIAVALIRDFYKSYNLSLISIHDGSLKILKTPNLLKTAPRNVTFTPDSRYMIVDLPQKEEDPKHDIFALSMDGAEEFRVVEHPSDDSVLDWIPGSNDLLFLSDRTGTHDAWMIEVAAGRPHGEPRLVRKNLGSVSPLGLSRTGDFIYSVNTDMVDTYLASIDLEKKAILEAPKAVPQALVGASYDPQWSPDGKSLAYVSDRKEGPGGSTAQILKVFSLEAGETREVPTKITRFGRPRWASDNSSVFIVGSYGKASLALSRIDVRTGETTFYVDSEPGANIKFIAPSPDGKSVYYTYFEFAKKRCRIMGIDLSTRETRELYQQEAPPDIGGLSITPDGKYLVFGTGRREPGKSWAMKAIPLPSGPPRELIQSEGGASMISTRAQGGYCWTPDGKKILFFKDASKGKEKKSELCFVSVDSGEIQSLGLVVEGSPNVLSLHPDSRRLAFSASRPGAEIWMMENFLLPERADRVALEKESEEIRIRKVWDNAIDSFFTGAVSPDGRYMTYVDWQNFANLGVRDLVKGENLLLTDVKSWEAGEMCDRSVFSLDGGRIAYAWLTKERRYQLRAVNLDGSMTRILHDGEGVQYQTPFGWTADGKHVLTVLLDQDRSSRIAFVSVADGSVKVLKEMGYRLARGSRQLSLSPDGKFIACSYPSREDAGNSDIFLISVAGGQEVTLVEHPADDVVLGWSPDGRRIFFTSDRTGSVGIWSVTVAEGKAIGKSGLVRGDMGNPRPVGITRDGSLYYGVYAGWSDIFVAPIDPATGKVTDRPDKAVKKYETFNSAPDWSPDGQFLVCRSSRGKIAGEGEALLVLSVRTHEVREVNPKISGGLNFHYIRWAPDGRSVLGIGQDEKGTYGALLAIDAQTGEARIIARPEPDGAIYYPDRTTDGKSLYFIRAGKEMQRLVRLDLESGIEKEVLRSSQGLGRLRFALSPDGLQMAIVEGDKIRIRSSDGTELRELIEVKNMARSLINWMPDGKNILYGRLQDGSENVVELWTVPVTGGEPQKTGLSMPRLMHQRVSPDGKHIAFTASEQPGKSELWVMENFLPFSKGRK